MIKQNLIQRLIPYNIIVLASQGDVEAIEFILNHFAGYINTLSQKLLFDNEGNTYTTIDEETKRCLEIKLITALMDFEVA